MKKLIALLLLILCLPMSAGATALRYPPTDYWYQWEPSDPWKKIGYFYNVGPEIVDSTHTTVWEDYTGDINVAISADPRYASRETRTSPIIERDYNWFGPTPSDHADLRWNKELESWVVPVGPHVLYPSINVTMPHTIYDEGTRDYATAALITNTASKGSGYEYMDEWRRIYKPNGDDSVVVLYDIRPAEKMQIGKDKPTDKIMPGGGGEIASISPQSLKGVRVFGKYTRTRTHNWTGVPGTRQNQDRTDVCADKVFGWQKYVVTVTGSGGSSFS